MWLWVTSGYALIVALGAMRQQQITDKYFLREGCALKKLLSHAFLKVIAQRRGRMGLLRGPDDVHVKTGSENFDALLRCAQRRTPRCVRVMRILFEERMWLTGNRIEFSRSNCEARMAA